METPKYMTEATEITNKVEGKLERQTEHRVPVKTTEKDIQMHIDLLILIVSFIEYAKGSDWLHITLEGKMLRCRSTIDLMPESATNELMTQNDKI